MVRKVNVTFEKLLKRLLLIEGQDREIFDTHFKPGINAALELVRTITYICLSTHDLGIGDIQTRSALPSSIQPFTKLFVSGWAERDELMNLIRRSSRVEIRLSCNGNDQHNINVAIIFFQKARVKLGCIYANYLFYNGSISFTSFSASH